MVKHTIRYAMSRAKLEKARRAYNKANKRPKKSVGTQTGLAKQIRSIALRNSETKHNFITSENIQLYHNTATVVDQLLQTATGTSQITRVGDEVVGTYLKVKLWLSNKLDRPNIIYRVILYTTPLTTTTLTFAAGASANKIISTIDTDKVKVLKQKLLRTMGGDYSLEASATNKEHSRLFTMNLNLKNRKIKYQIDGGGTVLWQGNHIHIAVIPYDAYGTAVTDNIASMAYQSCFYFKDP